MSKAHEYSPSRLGKHIFWWTLVPHVWKHLENCRKFLVWGKIFQRVAQIPIFDGCRSKIYHGIYCKYSSIHIHEYIIGCKWQFFLNHQLVCRGYGTRCPASPSQQERDTCHARAEQLCAADTAQMARIASLTEEDWGQSVFYDFHVYVVDSFKNVCSILEPFYNTYMYLPAFGWECKHLSVCWCYPHGLASWKFDSEVSEVLNLWRSFLPCGRLPFW